MTDPSTPASGSFTFDLDGEEAWLGMDPDNAGRPVVLSQGAYGPKVAVPLILGVLARHAVRATFFVPGRVAERYPERIKEILDAGHEIAHHGYRHLAPQPMSEAEEVDELRRGREALEKLGATVTGYRAPDWNVSERTIALLEEEGFIYSSNFMDDIRPYIHSASSIVELPVTWILDDAAHFWFSDADFNRKMATNEEALSIWSAEQEGIVALGGVCVHTFHPQVIGRPGRLGLLETLLRTAVEDDRVRVATCNEIAVTAAANESRA